MALSWIDSLSGIHRRNNTLHCYSSCFYIDLKLHSTRRQEKESRALALAGMWIEPASGLIIIAPHHISHGRSKSCLKKLGNGLSFLWCPFHLQGASNQLQIFHVSFKRFSPNL